LISRQTGVGSSSQHPTSAGTARASTNTCKCITQIRPAATVKTTGTWLRDSYKNIGQRDKLAWR